MTTSIKTCFKCGLEKPVTEYYKHKAMADGYLGKCKECTRRDTKTNRKTKLGYYREYDRARGNRQTVEGMRRYRAENRAKYIAHSSVGAAIKKGKLKRQPCEICREPRVHAHHDDYTKPLEVRWLCPAHHRQWHVQNGEAKSA